MGIGASMAEPGGGEVRTLQRPAYTAGDAAEKVHDTPVLVDLGHGTLRHRRIEASDPGVKTGYFYHTRLKSFDHDNESESNRKLHVTAPPPRHASSRVFYVFGRGLGAPEDRKLPTMAHPWRPVDRAAVWGAEPRLPGHIYFLVALWPKRQEGEEESPVEGEEGQEGVEEMDHVVVDDNTKGISDPSRPLVMTISSETSGLELRSRVGSLTLRPPHLVHIALPAYSTQLCAEATVWGSLQEDASAPPTYRVCLTRV